jgi:hypothetical protein
MREALFMKWRSSERLVKGSHDSASISLLRATSTGGTAYPCFVIFKQDDGSAFVALDLTNGTIGATAFDCSDPKMLAITREWTHVALYHDNFADLCLIPFFSFPLFEEPLATLMPLHNYRGCLPARIDHSWVLTHRISVVAFYI